jgi:hypothetical protein
MIKKIKSFVLSAALLLMVAAPVAVPATIAYASCTGIGDQVAGGATTASGSPAGTITCDPSSATSAGSQSTIGALASEVVNIFSIIVGAASIIMIIYGGFRYITSGGSTEKVGSAKNTIIYAIVGLIIVALAQALVHFVLSRATAAGGTGTGTL